MRTDTERKYAAKLPASGAASKAVNFPGEKLPCSIMIFNQLFPKEQGKMCHKREN